MTADGAPRRRWWPAAAATVGIATSTSLPLFLVGAMAVQVRAALHFGTAELGAAATAYYLAAGATSTVFGRYTSRLGAARVLRGASVAAALVLAAEASVVRSWPALVVALACGGVASSAAQVSGNEYLSMVVPYGAQGTAFGIKQASVPLAVLLGGLAVPTVAVTIGFRWAFAGAALLAAGMAVSLRGVAGSGTRRQPAGTPVVRGARLPLLVLAAGLGFGLAAANGLSTFLVSSGVSAGLSRGNAGLLAALGGTVGIAARLATGVLADRRGRRHFVVIAGMLGVGALGYLLLAVSAATRQTWMFVPATVVAFGFGWGWNGLFNFAVVSTHRYAPAWATGITQMGGRLGGLAGPALFGLLASRMSYSAGWMYSCGLAVVAASLMLTGRALLRRTDWQARTAAWSTQTAAVDAG